MAKTKDLVVKEQFLICKMDKETMSELIDENLGGGGINPNDFDRVVVPGGGGTVWSIPTIDGEVNIPEIIGVLVHTQTVRAYWSETFTGGGTPPDCKSSDGLTGIGDPGGTCLACPMNQFPKKGETHADGSRGKKCSEARLLFTVLGDQYLPIVIKAPVMSLANVRKYTQGLTARGKYISAVYTKMTLEKDKNTDGITYSKIVFERVGDVEEPEKTRAYAKQLRPILKAASDIFVVDEQ